MTIPAQVLPKPSVNSGYAKPRYMISLIGALINGKSKATIAPTHRNQTGVVNGLLDQAL